MIMGSEGRQDRTHLLWDTLSDSNVARAYEMLIDQESGEGKRRSLDINFNHIGLYFGIFNLHGVRG